MNRTTPITNSTILQCFSLPNLNFIIRMRPPNTSERQADFDVNICQGLLVPIVTTLAQNFVTISLHQRLPCTPRMCLLSMRTAPETTPDQLQNQPYRHRVTSIISSAGTYTTNTTGTTTMLLLYEQAGCNRIAADALARISRGSRARS